MVEAKMYTLVYKIIMIRKFLAHFQDLSRNLVKRIPNNYNSRNGDN